jgi:hypothetical protein
MFMPHQPEPMSATEYLETLRRTMKGGPASAKPATADCWRKDRLFISLL